MKYIIILLFLIACSKESNLDSTVCYECQSKEMSSWIVLHTTEEQMQIEIKERIRLINDTLYCKLIDCNEYK